MKNPKAVVLITVALAVGTPAQAAEFWNPNSGGATYHVWRNCNPIPRNLYPLPFNNDVVRTEVDAGVNGANDVVSLSVYHYRRNGDVVDRAVQYNQLALAKAHDKHYRWVGELGGDHEQVMVGDFYLPDRSNDWYYTESRLDKHGMLSHIESRCQQYYLGRYGGGVSASAKQNGNRNPEPGKR